MEIGSFRYYEVTGRYRRWDDLYAVMTSVFVEMRTTDDSWRITQFDITH